MLQITTHGHKETCIKTKNKKETSLKCQIHHISITPLEENMKPKRSLYMKMLRHRSFIHEQQKMAKTNDQKPKPSMHKDMEI